jgi:hypothetical protein
MGEFKLKNEEFSLNSFIFRIEEILVNQLKQSSVAFRIVKDANLPEKMYADPSKLE